MSTTRSALTVRRVAGRIGAEIGGIKLSGRIAADEVAAIRAALVRHKVVFFRDQGHLDDPAQENFGRAFGDLVPHPTIPSLSGTVVLELDGAKSGGRANAWHTDGSFVDTPPQLCILRAITVPAYGGDTVWANTVAAYEDLPGDFRDLADGLWGVHSNSYDYAAKHPNASDAELRRYAEVFAAAAYETRHPVVRVHPESGERSLLLGGFLQRLVGYDQADSAHLMAMLQAHVVRLENTVRWRWSAGDVAIWDNRATQHYAIDDYGDQARLVRRVAVAGDVPVSIDGRRSVMRATSKPPQQAAERMAVGAA